MYIASITTILFGLSGLVPKINIGDAIDRNAGQGSMVKYAIYSLSFLAGAFLLHDAYNQGGGGGGGGNWP